ncbi:hypothetical protein AB1Y20_002369 [Prymnesium parvum]|uniref:Glutamine cyclotransferase n=1 Tax=Prymnesium parvum TaxID=97485 RepID=A0AB34J7S5_PRYPA
MLAALFGLSPPPPVYGFNLLNTYPHDPSAFTQGLCFERSGTLLESTGLYGHSSARRVDLETGHILQHEALPSDWFGEGLTLCAGACFQLLWRERLVLERDPHSLRLHKAHPLPRAVREGWGVTSDGEGSLYVSDGTSSLHVLSPSSLEPIRTATVRAGGREVWYLNDLQWVHGEIWANIFREDLLAAINPTTGEVRYFVDLEPILSREERRKCDFEEVLNGIAYDEERDRLFVTGKCWPKLYEIEVLAPGGPGGGRHLARARHSAASSSA